MKVKTLIDNLSKIDPDAYVYADGADVRLMFCGTHTDGYNMLCLESEPDIADEISPDDILFSD